MPPREDGALPKAFTWITGNPRSKKNITQIRRHAGQNSGVKAETGARAHSSSSPKPGHRSSAKQFRAVHPSPRIDDADESWSSAHVEYPNTFHGSSPSAFAESASSSAWVSQEQVNHVQPTWPGTPSSEVPPSTSEGASPPRKLAIWDLVNHSAEEEEQHRLDVLASTPRQDTEDDRPDYFGNRAARPELKHTLSETQSTSSPSSSKASWSPASDTMVLQANISKRRKATPAATANSHVSWRLGMTAPSHSLAFPEDSHIEQILLQTSAFYRGRFESSWSAHLREHGSDSLDKINDMEIFAGSVTTAGGLMGLGRVDTASSIIDRALPMLPALLALQTPQVYFLLADLSLSAGSDTPLARLRGQVKQAAAVASLAALGRSHPITQLLQLQFSDETEAQRVRLRELVQRKIHDLLDVLFDPLAYQATSQHYYLARVLSQLGRPDQARDMLSEVLARWEHSHGANHILPITGLLELSRARLSLNDSSQDTEALLSDAFRRTMKLEEEAFASPTPAPPAKTAGLVQARMGCIRTIGRLHVMRDNLETALMQYTAAVSVGVEELGVHVPAVQLALSDLDAVSKMIAARNVGDDSVRLEWLKQTPVEVGVRWGHPTADTGVSAAARDAEKEAVLKGLRSASMGGRVSDYLADTASRS